MSQHTPDQPHYADNRLKRAEQAAASQRPRQMALFDVSGAVAVVSTSIPETPLRTSSSLTMAREHFRRALEEQQRPVNTIEAYTYDLARLQDRIGPKAINRITPTDIAEFLGQATNRSTRKRRLTSLRSFFGFLIEDQRVLQLDPTDGFYPNLVPLRRPVVLSEDDCSLLLDAADADEPWSGIAIRLMLNMGLTRGELLQLRREHLTVDESGALVVTVQYEQADKRQKERRLMSAGDMGDVYQRFVERAQPADTLFPVGFQAVNGMVDRVAKAAGLAQKVTPQVLRHTFALGHARAGASAATLISLLGLVDEPRNRVSVARYLEMAAPPLQADPVPSVAGEEE